MSSRDECCGNEVNAGVPSSIFDYLGSGCLTHCRPGVRGDTLTLSIADPVSGTTETSDSYAPKCINGDFRAVVTVKVVIDLEVR